MESRLGSLEGLSYEQLKRKLNAFKGHLTRSVNQFESTLALPFGTDQAYAKVTLKIHNVEEVLEMMESKSMTEEHLAEVARGFQECDQLLKWVGDKLRSQSQFPGTDVIDQRDPNFSVDQRPNRPKIVIRQPDVLRGDVDLNTFVEWRLLFEDYRKLSDLDKCPQSQQTANLRSFLDLEMREKLRISMQIPEDTSMAVDQIMEEMQKFFRAQYNIILDKVKFHKTTQHEGQRFEDFYVTVQKNASRAELNAKCKNTDCLEDQIKVKIIVGLQEEATRTKLMAIPEQECTLQKVVDICRADESAMKDDRTLVKAKVGRVSRQQVQKERANSRRQTHVQNVGELLHRCREHGISMNKNKFDFGQPEVNFVGFQVGVDGIRADPAKIKGLREFPKPLCLKDMRSFMGMVNYLSGFSNKVAKLSLPLRPLMSKKSNFIWSSDHDDAFENVKAALSELPTKTPYDPNLETVLETDAAKRRGFGYILKQRDHSGKWRLIEANSRWLSDAEKNYGMTTLEMMGAYWATKKLDGFLRGLPHFTIVTDHQAIVPMMNSKTLDEIENPRQREIKERMQLSGNSPGKRSTGGQTG
ncbi:hypothetical protein TCAL_11229 [Tigriopus californicus]|uniref:RNA-directed DNA polymerase n=1 Tax=Tigriopus californicus TaxID=6832 RepID=A0A553PLN0_TIGCA|nr:hypothetical protein TCAL_11229 [Tigriopus californicus]